MVSIVIPLTGLRAVVAIALAATEAKKNEKTSVSSRPRPSTVQRDLQTAQQQRHANRAHHHAQQNRDHRQVAVGALHVLILAAGKALERNRE